MAFKRGIIVMLQESYTQKGDMELRQKIRNSHKYFFSHNLRKYIDSHLYKIRHSEKLFELIGHIDSNHSRKWENIPLSLLNPHESLGLGLVLAYDQAGEKLKNHHSFLKIVDYFQWTLECSETSPELKRLTQTSLGVIFLEKALLESGGRQKKFLVLAKTYLEQSEIPPKNVKQLNDSIHQEVNFIYKALVDVCLGDLNQGIKNLQKAAKFSPAPAPLWKILANIYKNLGMMRVQQFYQNRYTEALNEKENCLDLAC